MAGLKVAVVGGGLGGLMAARTLARWGASVTVYEARAQVGGRVLSDSTFANGGITERAAFPSGVAPSTATTKAVLDSTTARRALIASSFPPALDEGDWAGH